MLNCKKAKKCSGCQLQNLDYEKQLKFKQINSIKLLGRFGFVEEIIGMENPYRYRNKSQTAYFYKGGKVLKGLYQSSESKIVEIDDCLLEKENVSEITATIAKLCKGFKIKPYDIYNNSGFLRNILIRQNENQTEIMVVLVTAEGEFKNKTSFVNELLRRHKEITTVVWNVNPTKTPILLGEKEEVLYGKGYITDSLCGFNFKISPRSFYQINHTQTEKLYSLAKEFAELKGTETVVDAYCGTGTIGITLSDSVKKVIGVEVNAQAIADAKVNAEMNSINNIEFHTKDAGEYLTELALSEQKIDLLVTDPPRAGCSIKFLKSAVKLSPEKIVYISCNTETLARDLNYLTKNGYKVLKIQPVDMFPHTRHIETVVYIRRNNNV